MVLGKTCLDATAKIATIPPPFIAAHSGDRVAGARKATVFELKHYSCVAVGAWQEAWPDVANPIARPRHSSTRTVRRCAVLGGGDIRVGSCSADSRSCRSGDLFVALTGATFDGHDFARQALRRGATAILAERLLPVGDVPVCVVPDSRVAHGRLCQALAGNPSERLKVIGVTGTNGKTTTTALIASVLSTGGHCAGTLGTLGYSRRRPVGAGGDDDASTPVLANSLARMEAAGCSHAVLEVSSHALSQSRVAGIRFDAACVTNVRQDHLDYHGTLRNYRNAKARLFRHLAPESLVVLNADDPASGDYLPLLHGPVLTVSLGNSAGLDHSAGLGHAASLTAEVVERHPERANILAFGRERNVARTALIGDQNVYNCLQAVRRGAGLWAGSGHGGARPGGGGPHIGTFGSTGMRPNVRRVRRLCSHPACPGFGARCAASSQRGTLDLRLRCRRPARTVVSDR